MDVAARAVNGRTVAGTYIGRSRTLVSNSTCGRGAMVGSSTCGRGANLSYGPSDRSLGFEMEIQEDDGSAHSEAADLECSGRVSTRNENNNRPAAGKRSIFLADKSPVNDKMLGIHQPGSQDKTVREVAGSQPSQDSSQTRAQHPRTDESPHADEGSGIPNSESAQNHDDCYWVTGKNDSEAIMRQQEQEECKTSAEINFPCLMESRSLFTVDRSVPQQSEETGDGAQNFSHAFHCAGTQHLSQANNCNTGDDDGQEENDTTLSSKSDAIAEKTYHFLNSGFVAHDQEGACTTSMDRSWNADLETNAETTYDFLSKGKASAPPAECDVSRVPNPLQKSSNDHMSFNTVTEEYQAETSACVQGSRWPKNTPGSGNSNNDTREDHGHGDPGQESDDPSTYCGQEREYQYEHPAQYQQVRYQLFQRKCSTQQHEKGYQREEEISPNCHGTYGQQEYDGGPPTQVSDAAIHEEMYRGQNEENPARLYHDGMYRQDHQGQFTTEDPDAEHEEKPSTPHHEEVYKSHNDEGCVSQDEIRAQFDGTYRQEYEGEVTAQKSDANKHHRDLATAAQFCNSQSLGGTEENCAASTPQSYTDAIYYTLVNQGGYFASQSDVLQQGVLQGDSTSPNFLYQGGTGQGSPTGYPKVPAGKGENFSKSVDGQLQLQPGFGHVYPFFSQVPGTDPGFHTKTVTAGPDHAPATESEECSQMRNQPDSEGFPHQPLRMQTGTQIHGFPVEGHDGLDDDTRQTQLQFSSHGGEEMKPSDRFIGLHGNEWLHRTMDSRGQNLAQEKEVEICMQCHGGAPPVSTLHNHIHSLRPFMKDNPHGLQLNFQNHAPKNPDGEKDMVDSNQGMRPENHEGQCEGQDNYNDSVREGGSDFSAQWDASAQSGSEHNQHQVPAEVDVHEDASQGDFENEKFPDPKGEEVPAHDPEDAEFADLEDKDSEYEDDDEDYFRSEELDEDDEDVDFDFENACDSPYPPYVTAEVLGEYGLQDFPMWISEDDELAEIEEFFCEALTFSRPEGDDREPVYAQPVETDGISLSDSFDAESFEQNIKIGSQDFMASLHLNASNTLGERKKIFEEYINEIDDWYIEYCSALESVNSEFNAAVSFPFSRSYTQYPRYEFSRRLRRYRDAFAEHLIAVKRALGEEARVPSFNAKLRARKAAASRQAQEERLANEMVNFNPSAWRPQRGLPDKAVAVLKSWLFGNFLHPYPKDSDKDQLAKATGLTRGQVSNWFINARVRVWKPMIEDMYRMEYPEDTDPVSIAGDDAEEEEFPNEDGTTALPNDDGGGAISNRLNKRQCMDSSSYSCHDRSDYTEEVPKLPDEAAAIIALLPQPPNVLQQQRSDPILASSTVEGEYKTEQPQAYEVPHGSIRTGRHQASRAFAPYSREMLAQFLRNAAVTRHLGPNQDQTQDQAPVDPRFIGQRFNENQVSLKLELCSDRDSGATVSEPLPPATAAGHELQDVHHPQVKMEDEHRTEAGDGHMGPESLNLDLEKRERIRKGKRILTEMA